MDLYEEFVALIDILNETGINYALCGGLAVAFFGYVRFTKDIDLLIIGEDLPRIRKALEPRGFVFYSGATPFDPGSPTSRTIHRLSKIEGSDVLPIDLIIATPLFDQVWKQRQVVEWNGRSVQIVSREGLRFMKQLADRNQDRLDLAQLGLGGNKDV
ncbi:MAG TPA: hypothetical protein PLL06_01680 [Acidobacteriota bacterium]|nr:hypothetical protein [Acidobacteriota bacterium]HNH83418.1 hypothetical protein [Acidobacteriota bacterium]